MLKWEISDYENGDCEYWEDMAKSYFIEYHPGHTYDDYCLGDNYFNLYKGSVIDYDNAELLREFGETLEEVQEYANYRLVEEE